MMPQANAQAYSDRIGQEVNLVVHELQRMRELKYYKSLGYVTFEDYLAAVFPGSKHALLALVGSLDNARNSR